VVIRNFDVKGVSVIPAEADTPLIIDPNTALALATAVQPLQPISYNVTRYMTSSVTLSGCNKKWLDVSTLVDISSQMMLSQR
jgi:hypothetical protein